MSSAIFIRSYHKDFQWLDYCLKSIKKYSSGFDEICLIVPDKDVNILPSFYFDDFNVHTVKERTTGYIDQQISKLQAHHYTSCEEILYVDSDCCFFSNFTPDSFKQEGLPILLKTPYKEFLDYQEKTGEKQSVLHWQPITELAVGFPVEYEYMRRLPALYNASTLRLIESIYPKLQQYCCKVPHSSFSEFNFIGAIIERYQPEQYSILNTTTNPLPEKVAEQRWSWGGISPEIQRQLDETCS